MAHIAAAGGERAARTPVGAWLEAVLVVEARRATLWLPVFLGVGIWVYFALPFEPPAALAFLWLVPLGCLASGIARAAGWAGVAVAAAALAAMLGFALAKASTDRAAAPVLPWPMTETVEGRVIALSRSASGAPRVLLEDVTIYGLDPRATPERVRVSLLDTGREAAPRPGTRVRAYARLSPPGGPVEPGAFDFRLRAWFDRLGAVGYARHPALVVPRPAPLVRLEAARVWLAERRLALSDALRHALPGPEGAFAAAIVTGDRSAIDEADAEALRLASLAHLLAISGLHMGILTGLVFAAVRLSLAPWPALMRQGSAKKAAAVAALLAGAAYLALSGATVATQRAFVMAAVAFVAVLLDRPAITLRALGVAAAVVLALRPVSLLEVGFQMSFAATAALVAGYEALRELRRRRAPRPAAPGRRVLRALALYGGALLFTSFVAGLATAPYAAFHFNRATPWGLIANLAAVPAMGLVIAPSAIAAGLLAPLGLEAPALAALGQGIGWVLEVAHRVADLPGAAQPVPAARPGVLSLITLGGLWLCVWRGWWRVLGALPILAALALWSYPLPRPDLLISDEARLVGLEGPEGRALSHERAQGFAAETWLRRDGDLAPQAEAAARPGLALGRGRASGALPHGWRLELVRARRPEERELRRLCAERVLLVVPSGGARDGPCTYLGRRTRRRTGALAVWVEPEGLRIEGAEERRARPWTSPERAFEGVRGKTFPPLTCLRKGGRKGGSGGAARRRAGTGPGRRRGGTAGTPVRPTRTAPDALCVPAEGDCVRGALSEIGADQADHLALD
ncbi:MAG TPA: ComEC/Rec2 family competence protein, partial [Thermohalobaculum sp.]|nr:ComEC/Rec2 family competence protein [Thermohalobaculum sp.]